MARRGYSSSGRKVTDLTPLPGRREVKPCPVWCGRKHGHVWTQEMADRLNRDGPPPPPPGRGAGPPPPHRPPPVIIPPRPTLRARLRRWPA